MKTYQLLKIPKATYQEMVFNLWLNWCNKKSYTPQEFTQLSQCSALCAWWKQNLKSLESEFKEDAAPYHDIMSSDDALKLYMKHVNKLMLYYSIPLMKIAKNGHRPKNKTARKLAKKQPAA